jgi:hypothetical protein
MELNVFKTLFRNFVLAAATVLTMGLATTTAQAVTFTFSNGGGNGTGNILYASASDFGLVLLGNNNGNSAITASFSATPATHVTVTGGFTYQTTDGRGTALDPFGYFVGTTFTQLSQNILNKLTQVGTFSFNVAAGQNFGFWITSTDGKSGKSTATVSAAVVPLPAGGLLLLGAMGGLAALRRRKTA